jgi:hypothetical protein
MRVSLTSVEVAGEVVLIAGVVLSVRISTITNSHRER